MPVYGDLTTMPFADLLQWIGAAKKTGILELKRDHHVRGIEFHKGFIGSCSSDDPTSQFGEYLLARSKLDTELLRRALERQKHEGQRLGWILVDMGVLAEQEVTRLVTAHVEETVQTLFDWDDASFRFHDGATYDPNQVEVNLDVNDVLLRGIQYRDELNRLREVFVSSGIVLRRTSKPVPAELVERTTARKIFESIDGERTLGQILVHARASEILVLKLLFRLHQLNLVEVAEMRPIDPQVPTLLDRPAPECGRKGPEWDLEDTGDRLASPSEARAELRAAKRILSRLIERLGSGVDIDTMLSRAGRGEGEVLEALEQAIDQVLGEPSEDELSGGLRCEEPGPDSRPSLS